MGAEGDGVPDVSDATDEVWWGPLDDGVLCLDLT